jgi:hypothetical protein
MAAGGIMGRRNWTNLYDYIVHKKYKAGFLEMEVGWIWSKQRQKLHGFLKENSTRNSYHMNKFLSFLDMDTCPEYI